MKTAAAILLPLILQTFLPFSVAGQSASPRKDIPAIAKEANGAIVSILMSDRDGHAIAQGTGFLITNDGRIVTNYHVIENGSSAVVRLPGGALFVVDGVLAVDKARDVAVIKAHGGNFHTLTLGNSDQVQVGEEIVAIGNPLSLESTVSNGIVSGIRAFQDQGRKFLQITAPISPGSSGGPLFNMAGKVVGITTLYLEGGENLNFAIPINDAKRVLRAEYKIQELPNEPETKEAHESQDTSSQQKTCNEEAEKFVRYRRHEYDNRPLKRAEYTNHFDATANKCYVEYSFYFGTEEFSVNDNGTQVNGMRMAPGFHIIKDALVDGDGSPAYGEFFLPDGHPCKISPPGHPVITCRSEEEFDDLALKYFGTKPH